MCVGVYLDKRIYRLRKAATRQSQRLCLHEYINVCIHMCIYIHIRTRTHACVCIYTYIYVYMYIHVFIYIWPATPCATHRKHCKHAFQMTLHSLSLAVPLTHTRCKHTATRISDDSSLSHTSCNTLQHTQLSELHSVNCNALQRRISDDSAFSHMSCNTLQHTL